VPTDQQCEQPQASDAREEVNMMAKKDDGRRDIKKGKERDY
jgi:hypothetical protein